MRFWARGLGFLRFKVQGLGLLRFKVQGLGFNFGWNKVLGCVLRAKACRTLKLSLPSLILGANNWGFGIRVWGLRFKAVWLLCLNLRPATSVAVGGRLCVHEAANLRRPACRASVLPVCLSSATPKP